MRATLGPIFQSGAEACSVEAVDAIKAFGWSSEVKIIIWLGSPATFITS